MRRLPLFAAAMAMLLASSSSAAPRQPHAGEIAAGLDRLGVTGSVLYVAAHPDDENTRLLAWLVGEKGMRAGYLSLTRGDGGQNLIGTEQGELLGLIRTHELLAARRTDGAEQLFTRARDFGYSKSADEALRVWGHEAVLADVVLAIRRFQPDIIVTRFNKNPPNHGHHTASAILAEEAFEAAADPTRFPEQLAFVKPWRARRLLHNVSTWRLPEDFDRSRLPLQVDVGGYDPLRGRSWGEVSSESRSQHKSQGFGVARERGPLLEYFQHIDGAQVRGADPFSDLDLSWRRFKGTEKLAQAIERARRAFDPRAPHASIPALLEVRSLLEALPDDVYGSLKARKLAEVNALVAACAGLFLEVRAKEATVVPGDELELQVLALNRSPVKARLVSVTLPGGAALPFNKPLKGHAPVEVTQQIAIPREAPLSTPYWLARPYDGGLYTVADPNLIGRPEGDPPLAATFTYEVRAKRFTVTRPVVHVWTDPVRGELYRQVEIAAPVSARFDRDVVMVPNGRPERVSVRLVAGKDDVEGTLSLEAPAGWRVEPAKAAFAFPKRGDGRTFTFRVVPPKGAKERGKERGTLRAVTTVGGRASSVRVREIDYEHLPPLTVRDAAETALVPFELSTGGKRIGYILGPGDKVAESLAAVGYDVTLLPEERLATEPLAGYDAILVGVRAYNASPELGAYRERLLDYVEQGGVLIVQYQTNSRVGPLTVEVGPYPLTITRDRVTDENAAMTTLRKSEPLLQAPNRLGPEDFEGWVQERGLYFASSWDKRYRPVFSMHDPGEAPLEGGLLVADYGKGRFVYTGLAFFRQLPAGVPGAYRLLANLMAR